MPPSRVVASDGSVWQVGVSWLPRPPGLRRRWRTEIAHGSGWTLT